MQHKYRCVSGRLIFLIGSKGLPTGHVGSGKQHQHGASNGYGHGRDKVLLKYPGCRKCWPQERRKVCFPL